MGSISVSQMISKRLGVEVPIPKSRSVTDVSERINHICLHFQGNDINKQLKLPDLSKTIPLEILKKQVRKWEAEHSKLMKSGIGREPLVSKLPDYEKPEMIFEKIKHFWKDGKYTEGGNYAHKYLTFTPFAEYWGLYDRDVEDQQEEYVIPGTGKIIKFQYDLLSTWGVYEFKSTGKKGNLGKKLKEALKQAYVYDFVMRMKHNIKHYLPILIEICVVEEGKIYQYGFSSMGSPREYIDVDKDVLKKIFEVNGFQNLEKINKLIDEFYDNLQPCLNYDVFAMNKKFNETIPIFKTWMSLDPEEL